MTPAAWVEATRVDQAQGRCSRPPPPTLAPWPRPAGSARSRRCGAPSGGEWASAQAHYRDRFRRTPGRCGLTRSSTMEIAIPIYDRFTALDAVGPYQVLSGLPGARVRFLAAEPGPVRADNRMLTLVAEGRYEDVPRPRGPGGARRDRHPRAARGRAAGSGGSGRRTRRRDWTTSVCTGSLLLAAAGVLDGTRRHHPLDGARPPRRAGRQRRSRDRVVERGKVITAAGVSSGIDMALRLTELIAGPGGGSGDPAGDRVRPAAPVRRRIAGEGAARDRGRSCGAVMDDMEARGALRPGSRPRRAGSARGSGAPRARRAPTRRPRRRRAPTRDRQADGRDLRARASGPAPRRARTSAVGRARQRRGGHRASARPTASIRAPSMPPSSVAQDPALGDRHDQGAGDGPDHDPGDAERLVQRQRDERVDHRGWRPRARWWPTGAGG